MTINLPDTLTNGSIDLGSQWIYGKIRSECKVHVNLMTKSGDGFRIRVNLVKAAHVALSSSAIPDPNSRNQILGSIFGINQHAWCGVLPAE